MNLFNRTIISVHRITGTVIALFFFMWFVSGLILLYHPYPRVDQARTYEMKEPLPDSLVMPLTDGCKSLSVRQFQGQTLISGKDATGRFTICADTTMRVKPVGFETSHDIACKWVNAEIVKVDTLFERQQWVLYSRFEENLPMFKFYFNDPEATELFTDAATANVVQLTTRSSRGWAWVGAIPHKLYIPSLRKDVDSWKLCITIGGILCLVASLTGIYAALYIWFRKHSITGRWTIPYKERWLKWHFILGVVFAIPLVAWSISGIFSMQKMPRWLVPIHDDYSPATSKMWGDGLLPSDRYVLEYSALKDAYPDLKEIEWGRMGDIPVYKIIAGDSSIIVNASYQTPRPLSLSENDIMAAVERANEKHVPFLIEKIDKYDDLYYAVRSSSRDNSPLPVYKVVFDTPDRDVCYVNPQNGKVTHFNNNKIWRKYLFSGIHYLNLRCFAGHKVIWQICLWIICITGAVFCLLSAWIGIRWLKRKTKI